MKNREEIENLFKDKQLFTCTDESSEYTNEWVKDGKEIKQEIYKVLASHEKTIRQETVELATMLEELLDCPNGVDQATIPNGGMEVNPNQVVVNYSIGLVRIRKARELLSKYLSEPKQECTCRCACNSGKPFIRRGMTIRQDCIHCQKQEKGSK